MKCTRPVRAHLTVKLLLKAMLLPYEFELLISLEVLGGGCTQTHSLRSVLRSLGTRVAFVSMWGRNLSGFGYV